jgi:hypothetical protein
MWQKVVSNYRVALDTALIVGAIVGLRHIATDLCGLLAGAAGRPYRQSQEPSSSNPTRSVMSWSA